MAFAQCISEFSTSYGLLVSLFLAGLLGGATHCAGMCAPFVLAQTKGEDVSLKRLSAALLLPYHLGRMTTYVGLALVLGSVINLAFLFSPSKALIAAPLLMLAGTIFLITALPKLSVIFPWAARIQITQPFGFVTRFAAKIMSNNSTFGRYTLGVLLGLMPCGLVISALLAAASTGSAIQAGLAMAAFTIGTMPALIMVALGGNIILKKYPNIQTHLTRGAMVMSSLWLFVIAGGLVF